MSPAPGGSTRILANTDEPPRCLRRGPSLIDTIARGDSDRSDELAVIYDELSPLLPPKHGHPRPGPSPTGPGLSFHRTRLRRRRDRVVLLRADPWGQRAGAPDVEARRRGSLRPPDLSPMASMAWDMSSSNCCARMKPSSAASRTKRRSRSRATLRLIFGTRGWIGLLLRASVPASRTRAAGSRVRVMRVAESLEGDGVERPFWVSGGLAGPAAGNGALPSCSRNSPRLRARRASRHAVHSGSPFASRLVAIRRGSSTARSRAASQSMQ